MDCGCSDCGHHSEAERFLVYFKALHCPTRWNIIQIIGEDRKSSGEIFEALTASDAKLAKSSLYYHISELEKAGILSQDSYRETGGGAPEKMWRLKVKEINFSFIKNV